MKWFNPIKWSGLSLPTTVPVMMRTAAEFLSCRRSRQETTTSAFERGVPPQVRVVSTSRSSKGPAVTLREGSR